MVKKNILTTLVLLSFLFLLCGMLNGCNHSPKTDVWDGAVASSFARGDGTNSNPYIIETASQFAFLAQEINSGKDYSGKHFSLTCDLDLNNHEWTPIGNGDYPFAGFFNGNHHSILNLKIVSGALYNNPYHSSAALIYKTGLFAICMNSTIKNLTIDHAEITIHNAVEFDTIHAGILSGSIDTNAITEISNIKILNAKIQAAFSQEKTPMQIGGISGNLYGDVNSTCNIQNIQLDLIVSIEKGAGTYNLIGGIFGSVSTMNLCNVQNVASYLSVNVDTENCYTQHNYFGAFGSITACNNIVSISNLFSKITTNKICDTFHGYWAYKANAIVGEINHAKQPDGTVIGGYEFKKLFGFVEQIDELTQKTVKSTQLYEIPPHVVFTEVNCQGCERLPNNHGFDADVWDLSDLSNPKMKNN